MNGDDLEEEDFYDAQSEASQIKSRIVTKYFNFWTKVMIPNAKRNPDPRLAYMDFYCGPGRYRDGTPSTPVLILTEAVKNPELCYVLPFTFMQPKRRGTSHYLIFVSKHPLGYKVMKDIMAKESSEEDEGVPSFRYSNAISEEATPLLFEFARPLEELGQMLLDGFAGETVTMGAIFERHHVGRRFLEKNYKDTLVELEAEGKITTEPPASERPARQGKPTFADHVLVTFPRKGS